jgi:peptide deformylase
VASSVAFCFLSYNESIMSVMAIRQFGDPVLRQKSQIVKEINSEIKNLAKSMADTMYDAQGLGLAAVQVGVLERLIVIDISGEGKDLRALLNPKILKKSGEKIEEEGCLSISDIKLPIKRAEKVKVGALDLKRREEIVIEADDWLARALQHEIDHLEGKLIIDRASKEDKTKVLKELALKRG